MKTFMRFSIAAIILLCASPLFSQVETKEQSSPNVKVEEPAPEINSEETIYEVVDEEAEFTGGNMVLVKYLNENMAYPQECVDQNIQGKVYVSFVVEIDGTISNIKIVRGAHPLLDNETIRIISNMPKWLPGKIAGKTVRSKMVMPMKFTLE